MSIPNLTPEELAYYASLHLADPDEAALAGFLAETQQGDEGYPRKTGATPLSTAASACGNEETPLNSSRVPAGELFESGGVEEVPPRHGVAPVDRRRPSTSASTAPARSRLSARLLPAPTTLTASSSTRYSVTQLLKKDDLVGGVACIAEAALQTRCVELPARQLTSMDPILCFLNATHVYLQHNTLRGLEGVELLSQLQVLVAHHNQLTSLAPLQQLERLFFLDVSDNNLSASVVTLLRDELPCPSLKSLNLSNNPCWSRCGGAASGGDGGERHRAYVQQICAACPLLERLDDVEVDGGEEVLQRSGSSTESVVSDALERWPASAAGAALPQGGTSALRRVRQAVEDARAADATASKQPIDTCRSLAPAGSLSDCEVALHPQPHNSGHAKEAALLEEEQARLVRQLILRRSVDAAPEASVAVGTLTASPLLIDRCGGVTDHLSPRCTATEAPGALKSMQITKSVTDASALYSARGGTLQLYRDLQFTQEVSQARLQRDVAAHWDNVSRVLQTAQVLHQDRRRRIQQRLQEHTLAYTESLRLLEKESCAISLDRYRSRQKSRTDARTCMNAAAPAPVAPPVVSSACAPPLKNAEEKKDPSASKHAPRPPPRP
ncbi:hypothetical protein CUR178_07851 [Leishmania enriettii]|uniref:Leucine-rich repeat protein n=1 Tax=Leishmania enriettii TaxID=5663 RepID=A0A836KUQ9_LEIEN|nr:hypothetical protein CUR178_07851 [Leishmania enriettii]